MGEYVQDGVNGLTFTHRDTESLQSSMQRAIENPDHVAQLGRRGYLYSEDGLIPSKERHATEVLRCYENLLSRKMDVIS